MGRRRDNSPVRLAKTHQVVDVLANLVDDGLNLPQVIFVDKQDREPLFILLEFKKQHVFTVCKVAKGSVAIEYSDAKAFLSNVACVSRCSWRALRERISRALFITGRERILKKHTMPCCLIPQTGKVAVFRE